MIHRDAGSVLLVSGTTEQNLDINFAFGKFFQTYNQRYFQIALVVFPDLNQMGISVKVVDLRLVMMRATLSLSWVHLNIPATTCNARQVHRCRFAVTRL